MKPEEGDGITAVILAAGRSTRMGEAKQLLRWRGKPLLQHVIDAATRSTVDEVVVVVLGAWMNEVQASLAMGDPVKVVVNEHFERGHAASLRAGLEASSGGAAIVLLGDEPEIDEEVIDVVAARWRSKRSSIIRCLYDGSPAHPILLARQVWNHIPRQGDEGARRLITGRPELVDNIHVGGRPPIDVDTPDDFARLAGRPE